MKKIFFVAAVSLIALACKKGDNTAVSSWKIGNVAYKASVVAGAQGNYIYTLKSTAYGDISESHIVFYFVGNNAPAAGSYKIIGAHGTSALIPGQTYFTVSDISAAGNFGYGSAETDDVKVTVTVSNGKINLSMPDTWAKRTDTDSVIVSASLTQTE